jgi:hypothetical protein
LALLLTGCTSHTHASDPGTQCTVESPVFDVPARDWLMTPMVKVCPGSPVDLETVQTVLALWAQHGAPSLNARYDGCWEQWHMPGYVYIGGKDARNPSPGWAPGVLGITYYSPGAGREVPAWWAAIELTNSDRKVLTHEVGHIWLDHANVGPHVLYPTIEGFHWKGWLGVEAAFEDGGY